MLEDRDKILENLVSKSRHALRNKNVKLLLFNLSQAFDIIQASPNMTLSTCTALANVTSDAASQYAAVCQTMLKALPNLQNPKPFLNIVAASVSVSPMMLTEEAYGSIRSLVESKREYLVVGLAVLAELPMTPSMVSSVVYLAEEAISIVDESEFPSLFRIILRSLLQSQTQKLTSRLCNELNLLSEMTLSLVAEAMWEIMPSSHHISEQLLTQVMRAASKSTFNQQLSLPDTAILLIILSEMPSLLSLVESFVQILVVQGPGADLGFNSEAWCCRFPFYSLRRVLQLRMHNEVWERMVPSVWALSMRALDCVNSTLSTSSSNNDAGPQRQRHWSIVAGCSEVDNSGDKGVGHESVVDQLFDLIHYLYESVPSSQEIITSVLSSRAFATPSSFSRRIFSKVVPSSTSKNLGRFRLNSSIISTDHHQLSGSAFSLSPLGGATEQYLARVQLVPGSIHSLARVPIFESTRSSVRCRLSSDNHPYRGSKMLFRPSGACAHRRIPGTDTGRRIFLQAATAALVLDGLAGAQHPELGSHLLTLLLDRLQKEPGSMIDLPRPLVTQRIVSCIVNSTEGSPQFESTVLIIIQKLLGTLAVTSSAGSASLLPVLSALLLTQDADRQKVHIKASFEDHGCLSFSSQPPGPSPRWTKSVPPQSSSAVGVILAGRLLLRPRLKPDDFLSTLGWVGNAFDSLQDISFAYALDLLVVLLKRHFCDEVAVSVAPQCASSSSSSSNSSSGAFERPPTVPATADLDAALSLRKAVLLQCAACLDQFARIYRWIAYTRTTDIDALSSSKTVSCHCSGVPLKARNVLRDSLSGDIRDALRRWARSSGRRYDTEILIASTPTWRISDASKAIVTAVLRDVAKGGDIVLSDLKVGTGNAKVAGIFAAVEAATAAMTIHRAVYRGLLEDEEDKGVERLSAPAHRFIVDVIDPMFLDDVTGDRNADWLSLWVGEPTDALSQDSDASSYPSIRMARLSSEASNRPSIQRLLRYLWNHFLVAAVLSGELNAQRILRHDLDAESRVNEDLMSLLCQVNNCRCLMRFIVESLGAMATAIESATRARSRKLVSKSFSGPGHHHRSEATLMSTIVADHSSYRIVDDTAAGEDDSHFEVFQQIVQDHLKAIQTTLDRLIRSLDARLLTRSLLLILDPSSSHPTSPAGLLPTTGGLSMVGCLVSMIASRVSGTEAIDGCGEQDDDFVGFCDDQQRSTLIHSEEAADIRRVVVRLIAAIPHLEKLLEELRQEQRGPRALGCQWRGLLDRRGCAALLALVHKLLYDCLLHANLAHDSAERQGGPPNDSFSLTLARESFPASRCPGSGLDTSSASTPLINIYRAMETHIKGVNDMTLALSALKILIRFSAGTKLSMRVRSVAWAQMKTLHTAMSEFYLFMIDDPAVTLGKDVPIWRGLAQMLREEAGEACGCVSFLKRLQSYASREGESSSSIFKAAVNAALAFSTSTAATFFASTARSAVMSATSRTLALQVSLFWSFWQCWLGLGLGGRGSDDPERGELHVVFGVGCLVRDVLECVQHALVSQSPRASGPVASSGRTSDSSSNKKNKRKSATSHSSSQCPVYKPNFPILDLSTAHSYLFVAMSTFPVLFLTARPSIPPPHDTSNSSSPYRTLMFVSQLFVLTIRELEKLATTITGFYTAAVFSEGHLEGLLRFYEHAAGAAVRASIVVLRCAEAAAVAAAAWRSSSSHTVMDFESHGSKRSKREESAGWESAISTGSDVDWGSLHYLGLALCWVLTVGVSTIRFGESIKRACIASVRNVGSKSPGLKHRLRMPKGVDRAALGLQSRASKFLARIHKLARTHSLTLEEMPVFNGMHASQSPPALDESTLWNQCEAYDKSLLVVLHLPASETLMKPLHRGGRVEMEDYDDSELVVQAGSDSEGEDIDDGDEDEVSYGESDDEYAERDEENESSMVRRVSTEGRLSQSGGRGTSKFVAFVQNQSGAHPATSTNAGWGLYA